MSSIANYCLLDRALLSGDSFITDDSTSDVAGHARGDVTPDLPSQSAFLEGLESGENFVSTPGVDEASATGKVLRGIKIKKEDSIVIISNYCANNNNSITAKNVSQVVLYLIR